MEKLEVDGASDATQDPTGSTNANRVEQLKAQIQAFKQTEAVPSTPTPEAQAKPEAPPKAQPPVEQTEKVKEVPDPVLEKEQKVNESLAKKVEDKETRIQKLLQQREEMKKKLYAKGREAATLEKQVASVSAQMPNGLTQDQKAKLLQKLEADAAEGIFDGARLALEPEIRALREELALLKRDRQARHEAERIDSLGQAGHSWVYTPEGEQWFQDKFQQEPGLLGLSDPYGAAVRMYQDELPSQQARQPASAQAARGTPVLGVNSAVPPPTTTPPPSTERTLENLSQALNKALALGDRQEISRLKLEMRRQAANLKFA